MTKEKVKKRSDFRSRALAVVLILAAVLATVALIYHTELVRLYRVITLFEPDVVVENFRGMDALFTSTRTVHRGETVHEFERHEGDLPDTYEYRGQTKSVSKFIDDTWTTGLIVVRDNAVVYEEYYRGNTDTSKAISWSVAKSFVSALVGIAVEEGYIKDIRDPVIAYVPLLETSGYNGVSIKDVLQMSSGVRFNEDYADFFSDINRMGRVLALDRSLDEFVASLESERKPGTYNHYVSMNTQVLAMVLREATGKNLSAYLEEKIWKRIGMESDAYWLVDGAGMEMAFGGLNAVLRDYARFGLLYCNGGVWDGRQVVPRAWVEASVTPDAPYLKPGPGPDKEWVLGYGYQWWIPENPEGDFLAIGIYNQFIYINPVLHVVIAKTSAYADYNIDGEDKEQESIEFFRSIARHVSGR